MAFVSTNWTTIVAFILLFLTENALQASSKSAGNSNSSKQKNSGPQRVTLNADNPFLNKQTIAAEYHDNPFFTITPSLAPNSPENISTHNSGSNPFLPEESKSNNVHRNTTSYTHNPFLNSIKETDNNNNPPTSNSTYFIRPNGLFDNQTTRTKSDIKCEEYSKQFVNTTEAQFLVGTNIKSVVAENKGTETYNILVTGGRNAAPGEFPHMVGLGKISNDGSFTIHCGGTLISPSWVLTAAHCTHGPNGRPTLAKIGAYDLSDNKTGIDIVIKRAIRHPSYKPPAMYADIALIELQRAVTFSDLIKPACLYQLYDTVPTKVWASGWGATQFGGEQNDILQKAQLDVIDNITCSMRHNTSIAVPYGVTPSMICAGDPFGGWAKDTCQGDSGGPLQVAHPKYSHLHQLIGITSFGQACAIVNSPGVYTRVSHYLNWIEDTVWPNN